MAELEETAEFAKDLIREELLKDGEEEKYRWFDKVGLSATIMALLVAVGALLASYTSDELMIERTEEILEISYMEADRIDIELLKTKHAILLSLGESVDNLEIEKINKYQDEIEQFKSDTENEESKFVQTFFENKVFAIGVTLLSIALTLSGMSMISKSKKIWIVGLGFGLIGASFIGVGIYQMFF